MEVSSTSMRPQFTAVFLQVMSKYDDVYLHTDVLKRYCFYVCLITSQYMRSKIQNHLTTVQAKLNNMKLLRLQGIKDDPNKNKSFRLKKFVISHTYQKEYIKALEEALHWMKNDRSCNRRKHARI